MMAEDAMPETADPAQAARHLRLLARRRTGVPIEAARLVRRMLDDLGSIAFRQEWFDRRWAEKHGMAVAPVISVIARHAREDADVAETLGQAGLVEASWVLASRATAYASEYCDCLDQLLRVALVPAAV